MPASVCLFSQWGLHEQVVRHFKPKFYLHLKQSHHWGIKLFSLGDAERGCSLGIILELLGHLSQTLHFASGT